MDDEAHKPNAKHPERKCANLTIRQMDIDDLPVVFHMGEKLFTAKRKPHPLSHLERI